jgi:glutamate-1-semialdehyde 2,1-aminomutase
MAALAPLGPVYQAGTLSGNPLATAAGLAALSLLDDDAYSRLEGIAARLADGLLAVFDAAVATAQVPRARTLVGLFFSDHPVRDYDDAHAANHKAYASFFHGLLDRGVYIAPGGYEVLFPSLAHGDAELAHTLAVATEATNALPG